MPVILGDSHVFVSLQRNHPRWVFLYKFYDQGQAGIAAAPFGLKKEFTACMYPVAILYGPLQILFRRNNHLKFMCQLKEFIHRRCILLGRQTDPVPASGERIGTTGLQKSFNPFFLEL